MGRFVVRCNYIVSVVVNVEADNEKEAEEAAWEKTDSAVKAIMNISEPEVEIEDCVKDFADAYPE